MRLHHGHLRAAGSGTDLLASLHDKARESPADDG
jgi:hypothetical protein